MTERIAYNEYAKLKYNTIITMKICPSVQDSTLVQLVIKNQWTIILWYGWQERRRSSSDEIANVNCFTMTSYTYYKVL